MSPPEENSILCIENFTPDFAMRAQGIEERDQILRKTFGEQWFEFRIFSKVGVALEAKNSKAEFHE